MTAAIRTPFTACCRYVWASGDAYSGDWRSGCRHGLGTFRSSNGAVYVGQWRKHLRWGRLAHLTLWSPRPRVETSTISKPHVMVALPRASHARLCSIVCFLTTGYAQWENCRRCLVVRRRIPRGLARGKRQPISIYNTTPYKFVIDKVNYHKYTQNSDNKRVGQRPEGNSFFLSL